MRRVRRERYVRLALSPTTQRIGTKFRWCPISDGTHNEGTKMVLEENTPQPLVLRKYYPVVPPRSNEDNIKNK